MEGRLLLRDCAVCRLDGRVRAGMTVVIEGRFITRIAPVSEVPTLPGDWEVRCQGRLVAPGLVDCHGCLVSGQLFPWSSDLLLRSYERRAQLEHDYETALTPTEVEALTSLALARGLRNGVTTVFEHLHAPADVEGALKAQAAAARRLGVRLVTSHASTSESPEVPGPEQVEANARFVESVKDDPLVRGLIGVSASSSADDDLLRRAGRVKEDLAVGAHFRLAASDDDLAITWERHQARIVNRFETFGLLGAASIGAHARSIDRAEAMRLAKSRTMLALSPRAAQTLERSSSLGMEAVLVNQNLVGLGTGGTSSMWEELAAAFSSVMALARAGKLLEPDALMTSLLVSGPAELCTMVYAAPTGSIDVGALADVLVYDLVPPTEWADFTPHLWMQLSVVPVAWTIVDGRVVVREGQLVGADYLALAREATRAVEAVWTRSA